MEVAACRARGGLVPPRGRPRTQIFIWAFLKPGRETEALPRRGQDLHLGHQTCLVASLPSQPPSPASAGGHEDSAGLGKVPAPRLGAGARVAACRALTLAFLPAGTAAGRARAPRGRRPPPSTTRSCCSTSTRCSTSTWRRGTSEPGARSSWSGAASSEQPRAAARGHGCSAWGKGKKGTGTAGPQQPVVFRAEGDGRGLGAGLDFPPSVLPTRAVGPPGRARRGREEERPRGRR